MATWVRMMFWVQVVIATGASGIIYYRVGVAHLFPMTDGGPWSGAVDTLEIIVPGVLALIVLGIAMWVIAGSVQDERTRVRRRR